MTPDFGGRGKDEQREFEELEEAVEKEIEEEELEGEEAEEIAQRALAGKRLLLIPHDVPNVFRFEFGPAILAQVLLVLQGIEPILLDEVGPEARWPGFYQLFLREGDDDPESVYVGRTIRPLHQRLGEHKKKLRGKIPLERMSVRFVYVEDLSLVGMSEDNLIAYFGPLGLDPWGASGFGSKVTGARRGEQESDWSESYPPDLEWPVPAGDPRPRTLIQHIRIVAREAPLTLSVPRTVRAQLNQDFPETMVWAKETQPFRGWAERIEAVLRNRGWRIDRQPLAWYIRPPS